MAQLVFDDNGLEGGFAIFLALRGRRLALALCSLTLALWCSAFTRIALLSIAAGTLAVRRAVLLLVTSCGVAMQCMAIHVLADPSKARLHEQVKTRQTLVSMTVCMICAILSKPEELNLKAPVAMLTSRSIFHLVERYRLTTLLRLQWANLVCFALQEADLVLLAGASGGKRSAGAIAVDVLAVLLIGQALPLFLGAAWEARLRREFLMRRGQALALLGPFWTASLHFTGAPNL